MEIINNDHPNNKLIPLYINKEKSIQGLWSVSYVTAYGLKEPHLIVHNEDLLRQVLADCLEILYDLELHEGIPIMEYAHKGRKNICQFISFEIHSNFLISKREIPELSLQSTFQHA